jgi:hypothetical protein
LLMMSVIVFTSRRLSPASDIAHFGNDYTCSRNSTWTEMSQSLE